MKIQPREVSKTKEDFRTGIRIDGELWRLFGIACQTLGKKRSTMLTFLIQDWLTQHSEEIKAKFENKMEQH